MTENRYRLALIILIAISVLIYAFHNPAGRYQFHPNMPLILDTQTGKTFKAVLSPQ